VIITCEGVTESPWRSMRAATHSRSGSYPALEAYCSASPGSRRITRSDARRISSTGKLSGEGRPPASEITPG